MTVFLVGAGPGDPGLLTVRGAELLRSAEVVVHDRLADSSLLTFVPEKAQLIDVGKKPGDADFQERINLQLVEFGRQYDVVVRLKGGDPLVFGRGSEEALALEAAGIRYEIVPGVTSAFAVPAYAGVPVTHRGLSTSCTVVTGHRNSGTEDVNWRALAQLGGTIVVLMGVHNRVTIAKSLMDGGLAADTPVAATQWGTRKDQQTVRGELAGLGQMQIEAPSTIVIGAVAGIHLPWFEH